MQRPEIWVTARDHVGFRGSSFHRGHTYLPPRVMVSPYLCSTIELPLLAGAQVSWHRVHDSRRTEPSPIICHVLLWMRKKTSPDPLSPMIGRRAGPPWGMRTEKMALPFTNCNTRESGHGTFPGQHTRTDCVGGGANKSGQWA